MAFQASLCCRPSWRSRYNSLRSIQCSADRRGAFLWRVSTPSRAEKTSSVPNPSDSQPFWGNIIASNGAGPVPIPHKSLSSQNLAAAIGFCLSPEAQQAARTVADQMRREHGVDMAVQSFHRHIDASNMTCDVLPQQAADWVCRSPNSEADMKLSHAALKNLTSSGQLKLTKAMP
jgi:sterol 3beta-glucosyltransferase